MIENGVIYEFKTVTTLNGSHIKQLINYLLLTNIKHGKLFNFRSKSVEYEFVSTSIKKQDRYKFNIKIEEWEELTELCKVLQSTLVELLYEWGVFLEISLYNEALIHFLGGNKKIIHPVDIYFNNKKIGEQKMSLLDNVTAFHVSAITKSFKGYENNLRKLIYNTNIKNVQWINFNKSSITLKTIK